MVSPRLSETNAFEKLHTDRVMRSHDSTLQMWPVAKDRGTAKDLQTHANNCLTADSCGSVIVAMPSLSISSMI